MASLRTFTNFALTNIGKLAFRSSTVLTRVPATCSEALLTTNWKSPALNWTQKCHKATALTTQEKLMAFFDERDNWGEAKVKIGRPWKPDELRLKSNTDLHKLWYVLLKERNMLMTMETEYRRQSELFPNPERIFKVEESMENVLDVIAERDRAVSYLETGKSGQPETVWERNQLGMGYWRRQSEHLVPRQWNCRMQKQKALLRGTWTHRWLRLLREKRLNERAKQERKARRYRQMLQERYPDRDLDV